MVTRRANDLEKEGSDSDGEPECLTLSAGRDKFISQLRTEQRSALKKRRRGLQQRGPSLQEGISLDAQANECGSPTSRRAHAGMGHSDQDGGGNAEGVFATTSNSEQLPPEVIEVVITRASRCGIEGQTQRASGCQGHSNGGHKKRKRKHVTELEKGPVVVKVLQSASSAKATDSAAEFRANWINRHKRSADMLIDPKSVGLHPLS